MFLFYSPAREVQRTWILGPPICIGMAGHHSQKPWGKKSPENHNSISTQDIHTACSVNHGTAPSLLPVKPTYVYKRAGSGPATVPMTSATASRSAKRLQSVEITSLSELTAPWRHSSPKSSSLRVTCATRKWDLAHWASRAKWVPEQNPQQRRFPSHRTPRHGYPSSPGTYLGPRGRQRV